VERMVRGGNKMRRYNDIILVCWIMVSVIFAGCFVIDFWFNDRTNFGFILLSLLSAIFVHLTYIVGQVAKILERIKK